jgi:hypothetical protein
VADVIWACPVCEADLDEDGDAYWCPKCDRGFTPWEPDPDDPPDYQHPEDDDD